MNRLALAAMAALVMTGTALAQGGKPKPEAAPKTDKCVVTDEKLGSMGKPILVAYTGKNPAYKGKKVPVCCGGCVGKVKQEPDTYFKKVYGAAKPATKG